MNRRTLISGILSAPAFLIVARAGYAQTPPGTAESGALPFAGDLPGIQSAVSRTWGLDVEAMMAATPGLDPLDFVEGLTTLTAVVFAFDSSDNAGTAFDRYEAELGGQLTAMGQGGTPTVSEGEVTDLGDRAASAMLETVTGDFTTWYRFVMVQEAENFYLCSALAGSEEPANAADALARYVTEEGEVQGDEAIFVAEGGSSGGLWGLMPETGNEVLGPLVPIYDETLYPIS